MEIPKTVEYLGVTWAVQKLEGRPQFRLTTIGFENAQHITLGRAILIDKLRTGEMKPVQFGMGGLGMAKKLAKYYDYKILNPAGEWESWKIPVFLDIHDVTRHQPYSEVALRVPKGSGLWIDSIGKFVEGPFDALWSRKRKEFVAYFPDITKVSERTITKWVVY